MSNEAEAVRYRFLIEQDDMQVASVDAPDRATAMHEAEHYASVYGQDGPVQVFELVPVDLSASTQSEAGKREALTGALTPDYVVFMPSGWERELHPVNGAWVEAAHDRLVEQFPDEAKALLGLARDRESLVIAARNCLPVTEYAKHHEGYLAALRTRTTPAGGGVNAELLEALKRLVSKYGYHDDGEPKDWSEYEDARAAIAKAEAATPAERQDGWAEALQEPKYAFRDGRVVNRASGETIPLDEPVMVFRARDHHALPMIRHYAELVRNPEHRAIVLERAADFQRFAVEHPERMREPDTERAALGQRTAEGAGR